MAARVDYVVSVDWDKLTYDTLFPKLILIIDTLDVERVIDVWVGYAMALDPNWVVPKNHLHSFLNSDYFEKLCLPTASGGEQVLGTNDPVAWHFFNDLNIEIVWLEKVMYRPETPILLRTYNLFNHVKEEKLLYWEVEYLDEKLKNSKGRWKRIGNRLSSEE